MAEVVGDRENEKDTGLEEVGDTVGDDVCLSEGDDVGLLVDGFSVVSFRGVGSLVVGLALVGLLVVGLLVGCSLGIIDGQQNAWATNIIVHVGSSNANVEEYSSTCAQVVSPSDGMTISGLGRPPAQKLHIAEGLRVVGVLVGGSLAAVGAAV